MNRSPSDSSSKIEKFKSKEKEKLSQENQSDDNEENESALEESLKKDRLRARLRHQELKNKDLEDSIKLRKIYACCTGFFVIVFITSILCIITYKFHGRVNSTVLSALIGTIPASMALFAWVLKGLFLKNN